MQYAKRLLLGEATSNSEKSSGLIENMLPHNHAWWLYVPTYGFSSARTYWRYSYLLSTKYTLGGKHLSTYSDNLKYLVHFN